MQWHVEKLGSSRVLDTATDSYTFFFFGGGGGGGGAQAIDTYRTLTQQRTVSLSTGDSRWAH